MGQFSAEEVERQANKQPHNMLANADICVQFRYGVVT